MSGKGGGRLAAGRALPWQRRALLALAPLATLMIRALRGSVRLRHHGDETLRRWEAEDRRVIFAFWHRHLLLMRYCYRGQKASVLISQHRDGELIARAARGLGIEASRGSTTRGGIVGLRDLLRRARLGYDLGFTPDGPRGPAGVVKPGVILAAQSTGWPIVPVALAADRFTRLDTWDSFVLPWPLSTVHFVYGEPLFAERRGSVEKAARELAARLDAAETTALRLAGHG